MVALNTYGPGIAGSDSSSYTQTNTLFAGVAPTKTSYGTVFSALAAYSLVGRVTITGELVLADIAAADGSQTPIGVTTHAVADPDDSNSAADSNSSLVGEGQRVGFYTDGVFNFDVVNKAAGWTLDSLRRAVEAAGQSIGFDIIQTATPTEPAGT